MDIRDEISLSEDDSLPKSSSLRISDQNKHHNKLPGVKGIGRVSPMKSKSKVTGKSDYPKSRWTLMSERLLNKASDDIVCNPQPVCQYNPITGEVINESDKAPIVKEKLVDIIEKSIVVKESDKAPVVIEKLAVDEKNNPKVTSKVSKGKSLDVSKYKRKTELPKYNQKDNPKDKESDKAPVVAAVEKLGDVIKKSIVVKKSDKAPIVKESDKVPVVMESDKASVVAPVLKEKPTDVIDKSTVVNEKEKPVVDVTSKVAKDKEKSAVDVTSKVGKSEAVVHKDKALDVVSKDKTKGNPPSVVGKGNALSFVGKAKDKLFVFKGKVPTELPKKKHKVDIPKDKPKPKDKHKVDLEVHVLRSNPKVKAKASVSKDVKCKWMLSKEDHTKNKFELNMIKGKMVSDEVDSDEVSDRNKKIKIKADVKRKRKGGSDPDSDSVDEEKLRRVLKKLKKIKTEYSNEESGLKSNKKGRRKEKQLTPKEAAHEEYLREFLTIRTRLTFETGDYVEVTPSKIHDILGIPVGGISLFSLDVRPIDHEFVRSCVDQFYLKSLKDIQVGDIASKVISAQQVDFLFKVNFLTLFTNTMGRVAGLKGHICLDVVKCLHEESVISDIDWCGYIHSCLEDNELPKKPTLHYLGPFTFLIALFKKTDKKLASICSERVVLEDLMKKASSDYPGDQKFVELQEKYVQVFRYLISFNDDVNSVDGGNDSDRDDDRDDENDDGPPTPDRMPTHASNANANPGKGIVKPSSYLLSSYMNKKTKVVPKVTRLEFSIGNSLFAMQGDKIQNLCLMVHCLLMMTNEESSHIKLRLSLKAMKVFFPICNHGHFYVVVFSLTSTNSMTILDNCVANYDTKYKEVCDLLKRLFAQHLKLYGHSWHGTVGRLKHRIPKLKWRTSGNFHDCRVFTMLHTESFNGETTAKWDCGLSVESGLQCDMLRRLRFKFATNILLHEINVHSKKMLELANEFDKVDSLERMAIIVEAVKNMEEHDRI
nr:hypothetical protein [Tanacetum cinerariifolium]